MYIRRHMEVAIKKLGAFYPVVLVTGARQVGKSTVLQNLFADLPYITMDNDLSFKSLQSDPVGYLEQLGYPLIVDEIQRVPASFINFKYLVDKIAGRGMYFLTGSQKFALMKGVSDSLSGRIGVLELLGLSNREINNDGCDLPFLPSSGYISGRGKCVHLGPQKLWERIHRGFFPRLYAEPNLPVEDFYAAYVDTYLTRDVRQLQQVGNLLAFQQFMTALAARSGQLLNLASLGREVGIDQRTAKQWLSILEASNVIYLLSPFGLNVTKRIVKTPKVYFLDTGLVCYLCGWSSPLTASRGAMSGQLFETYVIGEIMKSYRNCGRTPRMYFYRDSHSVEIDLMLYEDNVLYPVEIKRTGTPEGKDAKSFGLLAEAYPSVQIGEGAVICNCGEIGFLAPGVRALPVEMI